VISARLVGNQAVISFRDTGVGIPAEELPNIWDRLYRGDKSRSQPGLGLGLSLVKAIVRAHRGDVEVHSEPGVGSDFTIRIPAV
jgi:signal transduction histidine kinase